MATQVYPHTQVEIQIINLDIIVDLIMVVIKTLTGAMGALENSANPKITVANLSVKRVLNTNGVEILAYSAYESDSSHKQSSLHGAESHIQLANGPAIRTTSPDPIPNHLSVLRLAQALFLL